MQRNTPPQKIKIYSADEKREHPQPSLEKRRSKSIMSIHSLLKILLKKPPQPLLHPLSHPLEQELPLDDERRITARIIIHNELSSQPPHPRLNAIYITILS